MSDKPFLIEISESERIRPGDRVESISEPGEEYVVKAGDNGNLVVKRRLGSNHWWTATYSPTEIYHHFRRVTASPAVRFIEFFRHKWLSKNYLKYPLDAIFSTKIGHSALFWGQFRPVLATYSTIF